MGVRCRGSCLSSQRSQTRDGAKQQPMVMAQGHAEGTRTRPDAWHFGALRVHWGESQRTCGRDSYRGISGIRSRHIHLTDQSRRKLTFPATAPQPGQRCRPQGAAARPKATVPGSGPDDPPLKQTCGVPSVPSAATSVPTSPPGGSAAHSPETPGRGPRLPSRFQVCEMGQQWPLPQRWHHQTQRNVALLLQMHLN